jgi:hypothetical protein
MAALRQRRPIRVPPKKELSTPWIVVNDAADCRFSVRVDQAKAGL